VAFRLIPQADRTVELNPVVRRLELVDSQPRGENEAQFASAFENAAIGMALFTSSDRPVRINAAFCRMLGFTEAELMSRTVLEITHPEDVEEGVRQRNLCLDGTQDGYQREKRFIRADGRVVWGHVTCTLVRDARGEPFHFILQVQDITERKAAEQALRESEARFRSLTMLSSDWYWEQDEQLRFTNFSGNLDSEPWLHQGGFAIGKRRWELPAHTPLRGTWEEHRAVLEARRPFIDFQFMRVLGGKKGYVSCSGEPVFDERGVFRGYRGTARDITKSKLAEQRLHETQALLHMAAQIGRLGAWAYEVGQPCVTWSEDVCAIHEVKPRFAPTTAQALEFFAPADRAAMDSTLRACLRDGSPFDIEAQIITAKGRTLWVRVIGEAEWDARGKVVRILGACQDISEARSAAEETRLMAEQLTTTLESLTEGFVTIDPQRRFTYLNAKAERMLGRSRQELLGMNAVEEFPDVLGTTFGHHLTRALDEQVMVQCEEHYAPADAWLQLKAYPSTQGLAIYFKDVTARVAAQREILRLNAELEERVRQRTAQLEAANKELEAFSYSIAHDLRAPLSSIDGFSSVLEQSLSAETGGRSRHFLRRIRAGVKQMSELTDGLLSLAQLSRATLRADNVDLAKLARAAIMSCRERSPGRDVAVEIAPTLPARGDALLLAQVMGNLVGNAWKFTGKCEHARIEVGSSQGEDGVTTYYVRDNGAGFDMAHASRMFGAFQRLHTADEFDGTGIGLAIVHRIVSRHGGRVWAHAAPGQGATFHFTLG
jgi:PAS domain S-box-containing protein